MLTQEEQEIIVRVTNLAEIGRLELQAKNAAAAVDLLNQHLKAQPSLHAAIEPQLKTEAALIGSNTAKVAELTAANKALEGSTVNVGRAAQSVAIIMNELAMGRVRGLTASTGMLVTAMGGPAGLAAIFGLVALSGVELYRMMGGWEGITKAFGGETAKANDRLTQLHDTIKELSAKKHKVELDHSQLTEAKKEAEAIEAALKAAEARKAIQSGEEKDAGGQVKGVVDAPRNRDAVAALRRMIIANLNETDPNATKAEKERAEFIEKTVRENAQPGETHDQTLWKVRRGDPAFDQQLKAMAAKATAARAEISKPGGGADVFLEGMIKRASGGVGVAQEDAHAALIQGLRNAGQSDMADELENATPGALKDRQRPGQARRDSHAQRAAAARKATADRKEDLALTQQGRDNESADARAAREEAERANPRLKMTAAQKLVDDRANAAFERMNGRGRRALPASKTAEGRDAARVARFRARAAKAHALGGPGDPDAINADVQKALGDKVRAAGKAAKDKEDNALDIAGARGEGKANPQNAAQQAVARGVEQMRQTMHAQEQELLKIAAMFGPIVGQQAAERVQWRNQMQGIHFQSWSNIQGPGL